VRLFVGKREPASSGSGCSRVMKTKHIKDLFVFINDCLQHQITNIKPTAVVWTGSRSYLEVTVITVQNVE
jgi:hypothetical protein